MTTVFPPHLCSVFTLTLLPKTSTTMQVGMVTAGTLVLTPEFWKEYFSGFIIRYDFWFWFLIVILYQFRKFGEIYSFFFFLKKIILLKVANFFLFKWSFMYPSSYMVLFFLFSLELLCLALFQVCILKYNFGGFFPCCFYPLYLF